MVVLAGCTNRQQDAPQVSANQPDSFAASKALDTVITIHPAETNTEDDTVPGGKDLLAFKGNNRIETGKLQPAQLLAFAETLVGTTYLYGSTDPSKGFDCSGFITYVFNHFNIAVPRSSIDFTNIESEVPLSEAKPGDLVLFTGTDSTNPAVGHMGIVRKAEGEILDFIHSTSGKAYGVTITPLNRYYMTRFVKIIRIFPG
jgi:cell wall-associated NlpC family hydrolase